MKHLKTHKFPFKNVMVLAIECERCTWKFSKNFAGLLHFKTDHALRCEENKVEFLEGRFLDEILPSSTKRKRSIFLNFSFHFLSFYGVFLTLKSRTLVLKHLHGDRAAAILLKMDIRH